MPMREATPVFALSTHANYVCRHAGACCTSGWPIPVERETHERLAALLAAGTLVSPSTGLKSCAARDNPGVAKRRDDVSRSEPLEVRRPAREGDIVPPAGFFVGSADAPHETPVLAAVGPGGACVFYEADRRQCAIHRQVGEALLPLACRQFPRVSLLDGRGLFVTLSHYCPTVAAALFDPDNLRVVEMPLDPSIEEREARGEAGVLAPHALLLAPLSFYDPLDAREALPPLLSPSVLFDLGTYDRWERWVVATLGRDDLSPEEAVARVGRVAEALRCWRPGGIALAGHLAVVEESAKGSGPIADAADTYAVPAKGSGTAFCTLVADCVPDGYRPIVPGEDIAGTDARWVAGAWPAFGRPTRRFLAAKVFGSWLAYQGRGVRTIAFSLQAALSVLRLHCAVQCRDAGRPLDRPLYIEAVRRTDELLLHLASREALARAFSHVETA